MRTKIVAILTLVLCTVWLQISAQNNAIEKLEKVTVKDFNPISPVVDSNANAVILADIGSSEFEGNSTGDFTIVFSHSKRLLIRNKKAFKEATVKIPIYIGKTFTDEEKFENFEATVYNLKDGSIESKKLDVQSVFKEKYNSEFTIRKFTFPDVTEGSIIEFKYVIKSPFNIFYENLRSWKFQSIYPILFTKYHILVPPMFSYLILRQGKVPFTIDSTRSLYQTYRVIINGDGTTDSELFKFSGDAKYNIWAIKNVPPLKDELYASNLSNYITKIDLPLYSIHYTTNSPTEQIIKKWPDAIAKLLSRPDYAYTLANVNTWLNDDMKQYQSIVAPLEKAKMLYNAIKNNFKCTNYDASLRLSDPLKKIYQSRSGTATDINLLLIAMLTHEGYDVKPAILSTKENGKVTEEVPILHQYNYVIARLKIDTTYYLLDAAYPKLGFGKLRENCYNGSARVLDDNATLISLQNDDLIEEKSTIVFIGNDDKGVITGTYNTTLGYNESLTIREKYGNKVLEDFTKDLTKSVTSEIEVSNVQMDSLKVYEEPIGLRYDLKFNFNDADIIYFNPLLSDAMVKNPFTAADRFFPVEMPHKTNHVYTLNMEVPKGYRIDEVPKSSRVKLNDNQGMFEYLTVVSDNTIQLRSKLVLYKANFLPEDYETLRNFFTYVVKKQAEQIVFKKIK